MSNAYDTDIPDSVDPVDDDCVEPAGEACAYTEYVEGEAYDDVPATGEGAEGVERDVWDTLYEIEDPEMPISELHENMGAWRFRLRAGVFGYVILWLLAWLVGTVRYVLVYL